jgi:hypothetical protein
MTVPNRVKQRTAHIWPIALAFIKFNQLYRILACLHNLTESLSIYIIDDMKSILINEKGIDWLVCDDGRIFRPAFATETSRNRFGKSQSFQSTHAQKELSPFISKSGYYLVSAKLGPSRPKVFVHRLIAMAFVEGYAEGLTVNHINGNKLDNRPENLEWVTRAENTKHQWETGLVDLRGENAPNHKLTQRQVIHIRKALQLGVPSNSLSIIANVNPSTIHLIQAGKRWKHLTE